MFYAPLLIHEGYPLILRLKSDDIVEIIEHVRKLERVFRGSYFAEFEPIHIEDSIDKVEQIF